MDATLAFLTSVPGPTGTSALEFVLVQWFEREPYITGFYERVMRYIYFLIIYAFQKNTFSQFLRAHSL